MNQCLEFDEITRLMPQGVPFVYIDRVIDFHENKSLVAIKNVTGTELFTQTHFKKCAIYPGIYLVEIAAQASLLLFRLSDKEKDTDSLGILGGIQQFQFLKMVKPGDTLRIEVEIFKQIERFAITKICIFNQEDIVARGQLSIGVN